jgi:hypothetical protein
MPTPPKSVDERLWDLAYRVSELEKDMVKMENVPIDMAIVKKDVKRIDSSLRWLIGVIGIFAVSLLIAAVTFALNSLGHG